MKNLKISAIIRRAVDTNLWLGDDTPSGAIGKPKVLTRYTCNAIYNTCDLMCDDPLDSLAMGRRITAGCKEMGLPDTVGSQFSDASIMHTEIWGGSDLGANGIRRQQQARALWMEWCALMAKEQGV